MDKKPTRVTGFQNTETYNDGYRESEGSQARDMANIDPGTNEPNWLSIAQDAYTNSTDYLDANIRKQIEKNLAMFRSKHPAGSKYYQAAYTYRSKVFRPKTRATIRKHEAAAAIAFFSTLDTVNCSEEDPKDEASVYGARFGGNWLTYRLEHSIKWFLTLIGAYQDAMAQGIVISRQEWKFEEEDEDYDVPVIAADGLAEIDNDGKAKIETKTRKKITLDKPEITLIPLENFRFSTAADWRDPIKSSPFLIELIPMYVGDVRERMGRDPSPNDPEPKWIDLGDEAMLSSKSSGEYDSTRKVREGSRQDSTEETYMLRTFDIVWVHRNIIKQKGKDYVFYTLGTEHLLSEPKLCKEVYLHGRPYTLGSAIIETHRTYPSGLPELTQDLQTEANDLANQRLDNIKLILNKRYRGRRGTNTDWKALTTSIPGGVVLMDDLDDVKEESFDDVTASAYQEQDRVNADFDELVGNFSQGSIQTNRSLNETVGGMNLQQDDSNVITEYQLRVFTETWVEDTLRMLLTMGQKYETDERVLKIVGEGADPETVAGLMDTVYGVKVAIGFGATSPQKRIEKLSIGLKTIGEFLPQKIAQINADEVCREIFGALGYRDGSRFFTESDDQDPQVAALKEEIQKLTQQIEQEAAKEQSKIQVAQIKEQGATQREQMKIDLQREIGQLDGQIKYIGEQIKAEKNDIARGELILQQEALEFKKREAEITLLTDHNDRMSTVLMNDNYGDVPAAEG